MKKTFLRYLSVPLLLWPLSCNAWTGVGPFFAGAACIPAPSGGIYDSATLSGTVGNGGTFTGSDVTSPACTTTGGTFVEDSSTGGHFATVSNAEITHSFSAQSVTVTVFIHQGVGSRNLGLLMYDPTFAYFTAVVVNPSTGGIVTAAGTTFSGATATATVTQLLNGWFRVTMTTNPITASGVYVELQSASGTSFSYTGDGASGIEYWGFGLTSP